MWMGVDLLFSHILREDLRRWLWAKLPTSKYDGVEKGIDYASTVRHYRAKYSKGANKAGAHRQVRGSEKPGEDEEAAQYKMDKVDRGLLRCIWAGGMNSSSLLFRAKLVSSPTCPLCGAGVEDDQHLFWACPCTEKARELLWKKYTKEGVAGLPAAVRLRGLVLDSQQLDDQFVEIAQQVGIPVEEKHPPQRVPSDSEKESEDSEGYLWVGGDGAAPNGQGDLRVRRASSGLFYGPSHSHNGGWKLESEVQNAQRAEIRSAMRWVLWSWCKQNYITDSEQTYKGIRAILDGKKRCFKSHRDLWHRIRAGIEAKRSEHFKVTKVASHQTEEQRAGESHREKTLRTYNEAADQLAVDATPRLNTKMLLQRKADIQQSLDVQATLVRVARMRTDLFVERFGIEKLATQDSSYKKREEARHLWNAANAERDTDMNRWPEPEEEQVPDGFYEDEWDLNSQELQSGRAARLAAGHP